MHGHIELQGKTFSEKLFFFLSAFTDLPEELNR